MRLMVVFARAYPAHTAVMLLAVLLAGLAEGFGLSALLPLLNLAVGSQPGAAASAPSGLGGMVTGALAAVGLQPSIGVLLLVIVAGITLKCGLVLIANRQVGYTAAHVATDLRLRFIRSLLASRWEYFVRQPLGSLANSVATEALRASEAYIHGGAMVVLLVQAIVYGAVALSVSWEASVLALLTGSVILVVLNSLVRMARRAGNRQTKVWKLLLALLADSLQSVKPLKAMGREQFVGAVLRKEVNDLNKALRRKVLSKEALHAAQEPLLTALLALGIYAALEWRGMALPTLMVLVFLLVNVLSQLGKVQRRYQQVVAYESAYWSLETAVEEARREQEQPLGNRKPSLQHGIRVQEVDFSYGDRPVLQGLTLSIPAGQITTVVGSSGAGKTTLVDLLIGLLRPQRGEVWIDDVPLAEIDILAWRRQIGYVPQEGLLLHDSVYHNVALGDPEITEEKAAAALKAAGVWEFVSSLPQGLHSSVGERGGMISGGQRQRIAIARALVRNPSLLILDEPTSALDQETEAAVCETLAGLRGKLTILAISHQKALFDAADQVYRLEDTNGRPTQAQNGSLTQGLPGQAPEGSASPGMPLGEGCDPAGTP